MSSRNLSPYPSYPPSLTKRATLQNKDRSLTNIITFLNENKLPSDDNEARQILLTQDTFFISVDGVLLKTAINDRLENSARLVVPTQLREEVLLWAHDSSVGGHFGVEKTLNKIRKNYFWEGMHKDIVHLSLIHI